ncbi:hypothetical protein AVEN_7160-1 [Araneus ventricosus]|uniref:Uncharacterized protein n=1 Tax=Araneus ventricosus TaxID=182803 RepID=A0A4Y2X509_ARAVE|nr:hypothetical protein AVEN_7160-1 [Araneus ventricosus]
MSGSDFGGSSSQFGSQSDLSDTLFSSEIYIGRKFQSVGFRREQICLDENTPGHLQLGTYPFNRQGAVLSPSMPGDKDEDMLGDIKLSKYNSKGTFSKKGNHIEFKAA